MLTIVYHFEQNSFEKYYHDIPLDRTWLTNESTEDVVSHLYITESYYFNPKVVKRPQLVRLISKLKENIINEDSRS